MTTILQHMKSMMWASEKKQSKHVCPIVGAEENGRPLLVGSGVLAKFGNRHFVLTAAHVLDENQFSTMYFAGDDHLIELTGTKCFCSCSPTGVRKDDKYDVGFIELDDRYVAQSSRYSFVSSMSIDSNDIPHPRKFYSYIGFPHSKAAVIPTTREFKPKMYSYTSNPSEDAVYASLGFSKQTHLLVHFSRKKVIAHTEELFTFPEPWGMSGGGVWRLANLSKLNSQSFVPALVGIAIEYHEKYEALAAVKIAFVLEALRKHYPDVRHDIPQCDILHMSIG